MQTDTKPEPKPDHGKLHKIRSAVDRLTTAVDELGETENAGLDVRGFTWDQRATLTVACRHLRAAAIGLMGGEDPGPRVGDDDHQDDDDDDERDPQTRAHWEGIDRSAGEGAIALPPDPDPPPQPRPSRARVGLFDDACCVICFDGGGDSLAEVVVRFLRLLPDGALDLRVRELLRDLTAGEAGVVEAAADAEGMFVRDCIAQSAEIFRRSERFAGLRARGLDDGCAHPGQRGGKCQADSATGLCRWCGRPLARGGM